MLQKRVIESYFISMCSIFLTSCLHHLLSRYDTSSSKMQDESEKQDKNEKLSLVCDLGHQIPPIKLILETLFLIFGKR